MASSSREFVSSGTIASVNSVYSAPIHHLKAYFKPIQEGEGNASPSNIRAISGRNSLNVYQEGKNLLDVNDLIQKNFGGETTTHNVRTATSIPVVPGSTLTWYGLKVGEKHIRFYDKNGSYQSDYTIIFWNTVTKTFTVPSDSYFIRVMWYDPAELTIEQVIESNPIIEYGDKHTEFQKYIERNIIPVTFTTTGKNLIHTKYPSRTASGITFTVNSDWTVTTSGTSTGQTWLTPGLTSKENKASKIYYTHLSAGTYFLSGGISRDEYVYLVAIKDDGTVLSLPTDTGNGVKYTFDFDVWVYLQIGISKAGISSNRTFQIQLERGTSATTFEPYSENSTTVYGGYVDPAEGKIIAEYVKIAPTKEQFGTLQNYGIGYRSTSGMYEPTASGVIWNTARQQQLCNKAVIANPYSESAETYGEYMGVVYTQELMPTMAMARISEALYQTLEAGETVEFTYKLATPITYNMPSQMLRTLIGNSKYWSDVNDTVEVTYEVIDSMQMIEARKRTMQPQLLSKEGDNVEFNTKLQLPLKENTIAWQSEWWKSGTPSLSNVRIIIGKEQLEMKQYKSKNIGDLLAFSGSVNELKTNNLTHSAYSLTNNYTSISNIIGDSVTVTATTYNTELNKSQYQNGYFGIRFKNLEFEKYYIVSFDVTDITNNPLDASLSDMILMSPRGWSNTITSVNGSRVSCRYYHKIYESYPTRNMIEIHVCGMTATFSNFMVTLDGEEDQTYEPYISTVGKNIGECVAQSKTQVGGNFNVKADGTVECSGIPTDYCYLPLMTIPVSASTGTVTFSGLENTTNLVWESPILYDASKTKIATLSSLGSKKTSGSIDLSQYPDVAILYLCVKRLSNNTPMSGIIKPQVELGSTATEFEPYNNNCYKAFEMPNMSTNYFKIKATEMISDGWYRYFPNPLKGAPIGDYWIGCQSVFGGNDQQGARVSIVDKAKNGECTIIGNALTGWNFGETIPEGYIFPSRVKFTLTQEQSEADYIRFECNSSGTTIDTFLNANIYIVDNYYGKYEPWSNTLYGGELDLNTGILKITHDSIYLYASGKQYNYFYTTVTDMYKGAIDSLNADMYCNRLPVTANVSDTQTDSGVAFYANGIIRFLDADYSSLTPDEYNVQVRNNRPFITYKLKNPIYKQLEQQILKAIKGRNILTSNTDTIKVKYWVH